MKQKRAHHPFWIVCLFCIAAVAAGAWLIYRSTVQPAQQWNPQGQYVIVDRDFSAQSIQQLLDAYCDYRDDSMRKDKTATASGADLLSGAVTLPSDKTAVDISSLFGTEVITEEERRQGLISDMEWRTSRQIVACTSSNDLLSQQESDTLVYLRCDIQTTYDYIPFAASMTESAMQTAQSDTFTTQHTITLQRGEAGYRLIADAYNEEPTGMHSSAYVNTSNSAQAVSSQG